MDHETIVLSEEIAKLLRVKIIKNTKLKFRENIRY